MSTDGREWEATNYCPLDLVENYFKRYVTYPSEHARVAHVLWIAHTYLMSEWDITPRIWFASQEPGSGKSRALEVSVRLAHNPKNSSSITGAVLMRMVNDGNYTIFIDEIEGLYASAVARDANATLTQILNAGFERDAVGHRCEEKSNKPKEFNIYAPVMMGGLKRAKIPDSLRSRTITIDMKRRLPSKDKPPQFRKRHAEAEAKPIRDALKKWCDEIKAKINLDEVIIPADVRDRDADIWEPLFAVAQAVGADWPECAAKAAQWSVGLRVDAAADSAGLLLLRHCASILESGPCEPDTLRMRLVNLEDAPWSKWGKKETGLTTFELKRWLKDYGIKPKTVRAPSPMKGFHRNQFEEELARYPESGVKDDEEACFKEGGYTGYTGYNVDNENNDVTDVTDVTHHVPQRDDGKIITFRIDTGGS